MRCLRRHPPVAENTTIQGRDYYGSYAPRKPSWTWPGTDKHCPTDVPEYYPCLDDVRTARAWIQVPLSMALQRVQMGACFRQQVSRKGWKPVKRDSFSCGYVNKVTHEIDCKDLCLAHDKFNSCQVYTLEKSAEQFIWALFEEIVDSTTWEYDCEDDWVDN